MATHAARPRDPQTNAGSPRPIENEKRKPTTTKNNKNTPTKTVRFLSIQFDTVNKVLAVPCQRLCREYLHKLRSTAAHTCSAALPPQHLQRRCRAAFLDCGRPAPRAPRAPHASRPRAPQTHAGSPRHIENEKRKPTTTKKRKTHLIWWKRSRMKEDKEEEAKEEDS